MEEKKPSKRCLEKNQLDLFENDCKNPEPKRAYQMSDACFTQASSSNISTNEEYFEKYKSQLEACQSLLRKRLDLSKCNSNYNDPTLVAQRKIVSAQLSKLICAPNGVKTLLISIDQISGLSFWNTLIACHSLSTIILSVPQKNVFEVMKEFRDLMQIESWGRKLSLLMASLIEISQKLPAKKIASAADVIFVDYILRPCHRLWEGNTRFISTTNSNGHWNGSLDSSLWIASCWLQHSAKMKCLQAHLRLDKLFSTCMVMKGRLKLLAKDDLKFMLDLRSAFTSIIAGVANSANDNNQKKLASYFVKNFIALSESNLPQFSFSVATEKLVEVVDNEQESKKLIFNKVKLNIRPCDDITTNLDAYIDSLIEFLDELNKDDKAKFLISLWSECIQSWSTFKQVQQWSLQTSKWSSTFGPHKKEEQTTTNCRFIVEYFMSALETLLDSIVDNLDQTSTLELVQLSKSLITTLILELTEEFERIQMLDLHTGLDEIMQTRSKTLHLSISLCGFVFLQNNELSSQMKSSFKELIELLHSLLELIDQNKHLPIGELQSVADSAQQIISLSSQFILDMNDSVSTKPSIVLPSKNKISSFLECLQIIENDYSNEIDGSVEIAERGHALIMLEKRFRNKCQSEVVDSIDGGYLRVFDAIAENLRHPDSYVYLAAINAICELSLRHHKTLLPKMMFLLKSWDKSADVDSDDEEEHDEEKRTNKIIEHEFANQNRIRCQVQMGEAIAKVALSLGDLALSYFDDLSRLFLNNACHEDNVVSASALSGLANLILACRGRYFTKIIHELIFCCEIKLTPTNDALVRQACVHLLRSVVTSCQIGVFTELKDVSSKMMKMLRRIRAYDLDPSVRLHADLALLEAETALNELVTDSLEKNTRVIK